MPVQLSRGQFLVLQAASSVDYLPIRAKRQTNLRHGVWRALVIRGYLRQVHDGWAITPEGRWLLSSNDVMLVDNQRKRETMSGNGKLPRYAVARTSQGWAVIDRNRSIHNEPQDVIEIMPSRHAARMKVGQLNLAAAAEEPKP